MLGLQGQLSVPIVVDAIIEQVSRAAAGQTLLAAVQAADQEAAAAAALEAAFPSDSISAVDTRAANQAAEINPQSTKKIVYAGDSVGSAAAGIVTGTHGSLLLLLCLAQCGPLLDLRNFVCCNGCLRYACIAFKPAARAGRASAAFLHQAYSITACIKSEVRVL